MLLKDLKFLFSRNNLMFKLLLFIVLNFTFFSYSSDFKRDYIMFKDENSEYNEDKKNNEREESSSEENS